MISENEVLQAENLVYDSYLRAQPFLDPSLPDALRRHPQLSIRMIQKRSKAPCVCITGSKGKGSVAVMTAKLLESELSCGLMTSPHIADFRERIRIDGKMISKAEFVSEMDGLRGEIDEIQKQLPPSWFLSPMGIQSALALGCFARADTAFNILECGKGARYDDVNNVPHRYSVINSIFLEHTRELGSTIEQIASDKAWIITGEQECAYTGPQSDEVMQILSRRAREMGVPLKKWRQDFWADHIRYGTGGMRFDIHLGERVLKEIQVPLMGAHQAANAALSAALADDVLERYVHHHLGEDAARERLAKVRWPGRMEVLREAPFVLLDASINRQSAVYVKKVLENLGFGEQECTIVIGIPDDKDVEGVAGIMQPFARQMLLTRSQNPHYVFTPQQVSRLRQLGIEARWTDGVREALDTAMNAGLPVIILGTTSLVSETERYFGNEQFLL